MARHSELVKQQNSETSQVTGQVDEVQRKPFKGKWKNKNKTASNAHRVDEKRSCGRVHKRDQCPAKDKECNKCHKIGHFASKCRTKLIQAVTEDVDSLFLG